MKNTYLATSITQNEIWKQEIKIMEDENINFKTRLTHILVKEQHKDQVEHMEYFQNRFLKMDGQLNLLRHEVREQLHLLQKQDQSTIQQLKNIRDYQRRLEVEMINLRENFGKIAREFNSFHKNENI